MTPGGKLGMHAHRSDAVFPVREMPLAVEGINALQALGHRPAGDRTG